MSRDWVKLHTRILDDPDINDLPPEIGWAWARMLAMAGRTEDSGRIGERRTVAYVLRVTPEQIDAAVTALHGRIVERDGELWFRDWSEWQVASDRERQAKHRRSSTPEFDCHDLSRRVTDGNDQSHEDTDGNESHVRARAQTRPDQKRPEERRTEELRVAEPPPELSTARDAPLNGAAPRKAQDEMFDAVCEACGLDTRLLDSNTRFAAAKLARELLRVEEPWTPEEVRLAGEDWYDVRWKGKPRSQVTPPQVRQLKTWLGQCDEERRKRDEYAWAVLR